MYACAVTEDWEDARSSCQPACCCPLARILCVFTVAAFVILEQAHLLAFRVHAPAKQMVIAAYPDCSSEHTNFSQTLLARCQPLAVLNGTCSFRSALTAQRDDIAFTLVFAWVVVVAAAIFLWLLTMLCGPLPEAYLQSAKSLEPFYRARARRIARSCRLSRRFSCCPPLLALVLLSVYLFVESHALDTFAWQFRSTADDNSSDTMLLSLCFPDSYKQANQTATRWYKPARGCLVDVSATDRQWAFDVQRLCAGVRFDETNSQLRVSWRLIDYATASAIELLVERQVRGSWFIVGVTCLCLLSWGGWLIIVSWIASCSCRKQQYRRTRPRPGQTKKKQTEEDSVNLLSLPTAS